MSGFSSDADRIRAALGYIPAYDRDVWLRMGMAIKSALGEEGFELWDAWSQQDESYREADARNVWKSIKADGLITIGSLLHEAKKYGFKFNGAHRPSVATPGEQAKHQCAIEQAAANEMTRRAEARAGQIWRHAKLETGEHRYLRDKGVNAYRIRTDGRQLIIPMRDIAGILHCLQFIDPNGDKRYLKDGRVGGCYFGIGKPHGVLYICEGYATGASIHEANGGPVAVAFNADNLKAVAEALLAKYPDVRLVICADDDQWTKGNPGITKATEAARAVNADIAIPRFKDLSEKPTDFNDLARLEGREAVQNALQSASPPTMSALSVSNQARYGNLDVGGEEPWPQPRPILAELAPVEALPEAIIPEPYRAWIADVSERMQTPPDFMATAAIVVTASVIGTACTIKPKRHDDWLVVPNLWGGAIGRPSVLLKTPAMKEALNPLARLELEAKQGYETAEQEYAAELAMHEAERTAIKDKMKKAAKGNKDADDIAGLKSELCNLRPPDAPIWRRYKTNDATIEKCNELMRDNPRGLLLFRDELVGLLAGWERPGHESDRAYFLEGWNGNQGHIDDRIGRGTTYAENVCVSLYGGIQPAKLQTYLYQCMRGLQNDGLMQRLQLAVYPDEPKSWKLVDRYPDTEAKDRAYRIIERLAKADFTTFGAELGDGDKFPTLRFADDAQEVFYEWLTGLQSKLQAEDEPVVLEHLGKYRSLMPSLALIFHLIEVADGSTEAGPVSLRAAELAAAWCDYLESHARRIYGLITNATIQSAAKLAKNIRAGKLSDGFTVRDVYRKDWHLLTDRDAVQKACDELVAADWLREQITPVAFGQKEKITYLINPQVRTQ